MDCNPLTEINVAATHIDPRPQGQGSAYHLIGAAKFRQNPHHAAWTDRDLPRAAPRGRSTKQERWFCFIGSIEIQVGHGAEFRPQVNPAIQGDAGAAVDHAQLVDIFSCYRRAAAHHLDAAFVRGRAGVSPDIADVGIQSPQAGITRTVGSDPYLKSGCQNCLSVGRRNGAAVRHVSTHQRNAPAHISVRGGGRKLRARKHGHVAILPARRRRRRSEWHIACLRQTGKEELRRAGLIQQATADQTVIDG